MWQASAPATSPDTQPASCLTAELVGDRRIPVTHQFYVVLYHKPHKHIANCLCVCKNETVTQQTHLTAAAKLFKTLGNESRLLLLRLLDEEPRTVSALAEASGLSQPLVSQHLRTLKQVKLVTASRNGKEITYQVCDHHVTHIIADTLTHAAEDK